MHGCSSIIIFLPVPKKREDDFLLFYDEKMTAEENHPCLKLFTDWQSLGSSVTSSLTNFPFVVCPKNMKAIFFKNKGTLSFLKGTMKIIWRQKRWDTYRLPVFAFYLGLIFDEQECKFYATNLSGLTTFSKSKLSQPKGKPHAQLPTFYGGSSF